MFVLREAAIPWAEALRDAVRGIIDGTPGKVGLRSVTAGRGTVYFATIEGIGEVVIRAYRHGGIFGKIFGTRFWSPWRFFSELAITERARDAGITRLEPLGIAYQDSRWGTRGFWITRRLKGAENLHAFMLSHAPMPHLVDQVASTIAAMHAAGISHADLTIQNLLVTTDPFEVSVIDFDKAVYRPAIEPEERMRQLRRLDRSLLKWAPPESLWRNPWVRMRFAVAYSKLALDIRPLMKKYLRQFRWHVLRYQLGWAIQRFPSRKDVL